MLDITCDSQPVAGQVGSGAAVVAATVGDAVADVGAPVGSVAPASAAREPVAEPQPASVASAPRRRAGTTAGARARFIRGPPGTTIRLPMRRNRAGDGSSGQLSEPGVLGIQA